MKKKVVLINPPLYFSHGIPHALDVSVPPLGLIYLASYVNKYSKRFKASVIDVGAESFSLSQMRSELERLKPFAIGISSMTPQLQGAVELARFLKKNFKKDFKNFLGGPHVSADPDFINRFKGIFDYAITGEAEKTFLESIEKLLDGQKISKIQAGEVVMDLDLIPLPDRKLIKREKYSQRESMLFSRGCPYHCYYCSRPSISRFVRYRSVNNLITEIKGVYRYCRGKIDFQDDTFNLNRNRVLEFCAAVKKEKLKLDWRCNARIDLADEELIKKMKEAGCSLIHFGIEAGNERIRREVVNKGTFTNQQIYDVISWCQKYKIKFAGYFMMGHPGETSKNLKETQQMILKSGINLLGLSIPTPFPGSKLYKIACRRGIVNSKIIDAFAKKKLGEGYVGNYPVLVSEKLTEERVFGFMQETNRKFYLNFKTLVRKFREDFGSFTKLSRDAGDLFSLILRGISTRKPYINKKINR
ncbi:B12-binding domain-containing radical SAM protein [Patescibacteria group bacterium]